jgi:hypothetical protein
MSEDIENKVNNQFLYVLEKIKEEFLRSKKGQPIEYWTRNDNFVGGKGLSIKEESQILEKLEEMGAIKIISGGWEYV